MKKQGHHINHTYVKWRSPSNIAIIKYWGKKGLQMPINPSISFTLSKSYTETSIKLTEREKTTGFSFDFRFDGQASPSFEQQITAFLTLVDGDFPFLKHHHLTINSRNTFPHSAGIASSAASMSALALCLLSFNGQSQNSDFFKKASYFARLGSGSACRSVYGGFTVWGETDAIGASNDTYAIALPFEVADVFTDLQDTILIVKSDQKKVSSSQGHQLMDTHPYKNERIKQAKNNTLQLVDALKKGHFDTFANICEEEALSLHSLMSTSQPSYQLMEPGSLEIIRRIHTFRESSGLDITFTLDAGPNVHLLYPKANQKEVRAFIEDELLVFCENRKYIEDELGLGPELIDLSNE